MSQYRQKVALYAVRDSKLLVFDEPEFPEIGFQVPGGTIEPGETAEQAARREWREETGVSTARAFVFLGVQEYRYIASGREHHHSRHVFFVDAADLGDQGWERDVVEGIIDNAIDPEPGTIKTIRFRFSWMPLTTAEAKLGFGFAEPLPILYDFLARRAGASTWK